MFSTVLTSTAGPADVSVRATASGLALRFETRRTLDRTGASQLRETVRSMLRLDEDLRPFWKQCRREPKLAWVARSGAGRIMRSGSVFEDLLKLLFTTNCSWAATENMNRRLVAELGEQAPSGRNGFPSAQACAERDESFYRDRIRTGYRAGSCLRLARAFAEGRLTQDQFLDPEPDNAAVRDRLLALPGFGPYAAGQAMRLFGRHEDLALDSWCRNKIATVLGRAKPPADRTIEKRYRAFGSYKGLAMWMELTADWHAD